MDTNKKTSLKLLTNLVNESFTNSILEITCLIFKSIDNLNLIIYSKENKSIVCYDINNNQKINEVFNAHKNKITYLNKYSSYSSRKDRINLMLSISGSDNNLKVWNISNFQCLHNFEKINNQGWINCACFLNDNDKIYVLSTNSNGYSKNPEPIKVFDLEGKTKMNINNSNTNTNFIDIFYDNKSSTKYIITGNIGFSRSYNYNKNIEYHTYKDQNIKFIYRAIIREKEDKIELIESSQTGNLRIWNFHTADLIKEISCFDNSFDICLWDNERLLACRGSSIKIVDLNKEENNCELNLKDNELITISKIDHSKNGECLVSQGKSGFKLWKLDN